MKYQESCPIISKTVQGPYVTMTLKTEKIAREAQPGQFVNIRAGEGYEVLLRRPISICDADGDTLTLMVLVKGKGTSLIAQKTVGESLNIIGPLGQGFPLDTARPALFVGGGIGAAPFRFLSRALPGSVMLLGARSASLLPELSLFQEFMPVITATDDGSHGIKGTVIDLLAKYPLNQFTVYACGPTPMFRALIKLFHNCPDTEAYLSLENYMGCGFGACKGCTVETPDGPYLLSCQDGPVFRWNEVKL